MSSQGGTVASGSPTDWSPQEGAGNIQGPVWGRWSPRAGCSLGTSGSLLSCRVEWGFLGQRLSKHRGSTGILGNTVRYNITGSLTLSNWGRGEAAFQLIFLSALTTDSGLPFLGITNSAPWNSPWSQSSNWPGQSYPSHPKNDWDELGGCLGRTSYFPTPGPFYYRRDIQNYLRGICMSHGGL